MPDVGASRARVQLKLKWRFWHQINSSEEVNPRHVRWLLAEVVHDHALVLPEYIHCQVVLFLSPRDLRDGRW